LNVDDRRRATEIAKRIIESNFDKSQIAELDRGLLAAVAVSLREIMSSSQELGPIRALEEINPYYTPFGFGARPRLTSKSLRDVGESKALR
jgi:hypothetical protein